MLNQPTFNSQQENIVQNLTETSEHIKHFLYIESIFFQKSIHCQYFEI